MKRNRTVAKYSQNLARILWALVFVFLNLKDFRSVSCASASPTQEQTALLPGDILLVPLNCYVCNAIENETGVPYSHSVVVGNSGTDFSKIFVYEAFGNVGRTQLSEIQKRAEKKLPLYLLRPLEFTQGNSPTEEQLAEAFKENFLNAPFDDEFLWNNLDADNREKLYCSEFVVRFINLFLNTPQTTEPMKFSKQLSFWEKYYKQFNLPVPQNEPGVSPATLYASSLFLKLGPIKN